MLTRKSIDYAVMEPASQGKGKAQVVVVEMNVNWTDIGSWPALAETLPNDGNDNAVDSLVAVLVDSFNNIVISHDPNHLMALVGVSDMIVVHTPDVTMVCPKTEAQKVKELVNRVKERTGKYQ
jgi:mannose-1-phosphate guanylyltransferase